MFRDTIFEYAKAGYPALYVVTHEEHRLEAEVAEAGKLLNPSGPCGAGP